MTVWLDNNIACRGPDLCLCLSEKEYLKALKDIGVKPVHDWIKNDHSDATVHYMQNPSGGLVVIMCMRVRDGISGIQIAGLIAHEAVHIWQAYAEFIGEDSPGKEQEAYAVQCVFQSLAGEYARRIEAKSL